LNGGKVVSSKVKFSKFYLIIDVTPEDEVDAMEVYFKIQNQLRKQVQAHKLGENGFKPGIDGAYFNAFENVNESFKFLEDAIAAVGVNVSDPF
jgi:enolase